MRSRREFAKFLLMGAGALLGSPSGFSGESATGVSSVPGSKSPWAEVPAILTRIKAPIFPNRDFDIARYGAIAGGEGDSTAAFKKTVAACSTAGGGRVVVPAGTFLTGAIELKSNVNLHVSDGATILFTHDTGKYPVVFTRWEGVELMNYSPFIYAHKQQNVAITGQGTIDGNADCEHWWPWKGHASCGWKSGDPNQEFDRNHLFEMAERGVPVEQRVFGPGHYLRPQFIQPYLCQNVLIEGVKLLRSPMWQIHPVLCENVIVRGLSISAFGPNTDGCDPESCTDVHIADCSFNTGDDCIAIKSGRNADGRRIGVPTRNVVIQDCHMKDGHGGVTVGSEISGGVSNVFAENCQMDSPHLDMAIRLKDNAMRGGLLENINVRNITVGQVAFANVSIDFNYEEGAKGDFTPIVRKVNIEGVKSEKAEYAIYLRGFPKSPISDVTIEDCDFRGVAKPNVIENVRNVELRNVQINGKTVSTRG